MHRDGRTGGEECGCGGGPSGCADCGLCESCAQHGSSRSSVRTQSQGDTDERSTFTVHVGGDSYTVQSTAASLAEFKSAQHMRTLRRDFAAKLGISLAELPEIQIDESAAVINPRACGLRGNRRKAERIIENHRVEWLRVAQLAVPEVAKATNPRFCDGGADAEKTVVCDGLLRVRDDTPCKHDRNHQPFYQ